MIDEPLVIPFSPGAALARLTQVEGALSRHGAIARALDTFPTASNSATHSVTGMKSDVEPSNSSTNESEEWTRSLQEARHGLLQALASDDRAQIQQHFAAAQALLLRCYETVCTPGRWDETGDLSLAKVLETLKFPDPQRRREALVDVVDVSTLLVTYFKPQRQVLTTLSFADAAGATAYWLSEIRIVAGEDYEDQLIDNRAPVFPRVRLSIGRHRLRIESRNPHARAVSSEFTIEVPDL